jgi:hypothetical protein
MGATAPALTSTTSSRPGNFVIGKPYEAVVTLNKGKTDLQKTAMTKDYQLMMFSGCTTFHYLDDLRRPSEGQQDLDLVVSNDSLYWST